MAYKSSSKPGILINSTLKMNIKAIFENNLSGHPPFENNWERFAGGARTGVISKQLF
jgi:hypothetical protein